MERRVIQEFIEIYRSEPSLWQVRSPHYNNRATKSAAYRRMVCKLREVQPGADVESVKRKINALRTNYRKELRKVQKSKEAGGPLYTPSLWYFELFHFIAEQEAEPPIIDVTGDVLGVDFEESMTYEREEMSDEFEEENNWRSNESESLQTWRSESGGVQTQARMATNGQTLFQGSSPKHLLEMSCFPPSKRPRSEEDGAGAFGRYVSAKLRDMDRGSQLLAERLIAEVLFRGQLGALHRNTCLSQQTAPVKIEEDART